MAYFFKSCYELVMSDSEPSDKYNIKTISRCFQILDLASTSPRPVTIQDVCTGIGVNTNMAFRLLASVVNAGYMVKDEVSGHYTVSLKALQLSRNAILSLEIRKITMPYLELLWHKYPKANINMAVYYQGEILVVDRIDSVSIPRTYFTPGKTLPFHCTGLGKMLTCELPEGDIDELIRNNELKSFTAQTITAPDAVKAELGKTKRQQLARDRNEYLQNDNCNAVPIRDGTGKIIAAISLSAFESYMTVEEVEGTIPDIQETARKISFMAGFHDGSI